jgi:hypothetical protein
MMRSELVFEAVHTLRNRYMLCQLASKATRKFHKPNTRIQDTTNDVLQLIADSERQNIIRRPLPGGRVVALASQGPMQIGELALPTIRISGAPTSECEIVCRRLTFGPGCRTR